MMRMHDVGAVLDRRAGKLRRRQLRRFYFGDLAPGESTQRFLTAVGDVIAQRDALLAKLPPQHQVHTSGAAAATGDLGSEDLGQEDDAPAPVG